MDKEVSDESLPRMGKDAQAEYMKELRKLGKRREQRIRPIMDGDSSE